MPLLKKLACERQKAASAQCIALLDKLRSPNGPFKQIKTIKNELATKVFRLETCESTQGGKANEENELVQMEQTLSVILMVSSDIKNIRKLQHSQLGVRPLRHKTEQLTSPSTGSARCSSVLKLISEGACLVEQTRRRPLMSKSTTASTNKKLSGKVRPPMHHSQSQDSKH